ncbi:toxin-antitoxin system YwqK family antitoxin [Hymenobacter profundi]|uniref:Toxin-antitoxin system YwqK family antitoxin n=1 Tax=Hymenobacter profundi TaxID=1982110 RepID=A0ABS6X220_9BACT|nr:hypothetical protein [Hymenobacter profundi]MBW3129527.1 hypothetical protein [Hymenobacter profundi]
MYSLYKYVIILCCIVIIVCCDKKSVKYTYHKNGKIQHKINLLNNKPNGLIESYYSNGNLKSKSIWKNGLQNGFFEDYDQEEKLLRIGHMKNNLADGSWKEFDNKGKITKKYIYQNDTIIDYIIFYNQGIISEKQIISKKGEVIRVIGYDKKGTKSSDTIIPIFNDRKDTLQTGNTYSTTISFGYTLPNNTKLIIGKIDKNNTATDTFKILHLSPEHRFIYSTIPKNTGTNIIQYKIIQSNKDSLSIDGITGTHHYYVSSEK